MLVCQNRCIAVKKMLMLEILQSCHGGCTPSNSTGLWCYEDMQHRLRDVKPSSLREAVDEISSSEETVWWEVLV